MKYGRALVSVLVLTLLIYLMRAAMLPGFTRAESAFAEGAREMIVLKEMLVPVYQTVPYFDKPPFYYWMVVFCFQAFGVNMLASRLASILPGLAIVALAGLSSRKLFGDRTSILAAAVTATTLCFTEMATSCMPDMWLSLCEFGAVLTLYKFFYGEKAEQMKWGLITALCFAVGWMIKGPVVVVLPVAALAARMLAFRKFVMPPIKPVLLGTLIFFALVAPWHILVMQKYGPEAFNWLYMKGMAGRFLGTQQAYNFGHPFHYMTTTLLSGFLPWTLFLVPAIVAFIKDVKDNRPLEERAAALSYLLFWSLITVVFFSMTNSNWGYYNLPIFPALSVVTAYYLNKCAESDDKLMRIFGTVLAAVLTIGSLGAIPLVLKQTGGESLPLVIASALALAITSGAMLFFFIKHKLYPAFLSIFALYIVGTVAYCCIALPLKPKGDAYLSLSSDVQKLAPEADLYCHNDIIGQYNLVDHLTFQANRIPKYCDDAQLVRLLETPNKNQYLLSQLDYDRLPDDSKKHLKLVKSVMYKVFLFPNCKLYEGANIKGQVPLLLLQNN